MLSENDNRFAKRAIDALMEVINSLLPKDKGDYPHTAEDAIEVLMSLTMRIKYRTKDAEKLIWNILESDYGFRTKLVCIRIAKEQMLFSGNDAEKIVCLCKDLFPSTKDGWCESSCRLGLFYA